MFGVEKNCAKKAMAKVRSERVPVTIYMIDPNIDWVVFMELSISSGLNQESMVRRLIGRIVGFQCRKPNREQIQSMYAVCDNSIPFGPNLI
jgi:hypothetical protein